ncbi:MAG: hypothetical protein IJN27_01790 [Oscillospiraceae bacterium]|nr:hypothetical protein [Oscillospiraceae bacterium]
MIGQIITGIFSILLGIIGGLTQFVVMSIVFMIVFIAFCLMGFTIVVYAIEKIKKF